MGITPANAPEASVTGDITADLDAAGLTLAELHIDRAYLSSALVRERGPDLAIFCKAWRVRNTTGRYAKNEFTIDFGTTGQLTCPAGVSIGFQPGKTVHFPKDTCAACPLRTRCTTSSNGRSVSIHPDEALLAELRQRQPPAHRRGPGLHRAHGNDDGRHVTRQRLQHRGRPLPAKHNGMNRTWPGQAREGRAMLLTSIRRSLRAHAAAAPTPREVHVRVRGGYEPDTIRAHAGVPVRVVFRREESAACSEQVVFPAFGKSATLPQGENVAVDLLPTEPGEYEFTCGMGMLRGRLVVAAGRGTAAAGCRIAPGAGADRLPGRRR